MRPFFILSLGLALAAPAALAQENSPFTPSLPAPDASDEPEIALETLIERALANNPQPAIAAANLEAARARAASLRALPSPVLQVVPAIGGTREARDEEIILSQPLDLFGQRRSQRRVLEAQIRRAEAERTLATRALVTGVKNAVADLFAAQQAVSLGQTQVEVARAFRDAAARRAELGDVPAVQVQRAQLELDRALGELDAARAEQLVRRAILNQLIGAPPEAPLRVALPKTAFFSLPGSESGVPSVGPGAAPPTAPTAPALDTVPQAPIVGASSQVGADLVASRSALLPGTLQRPDVLAAQASLEAARAQAGAIARGRRPRVEIQARRGGVFDSASTALRAVVTVPLFDFGASRREQRAAEFEAQAQEQQVALLRSQAAVQLETALVRLEQNQRTVARYRDSLVPQTLDLLRKTQIGYAAGASTFLEVLEAQRAARQIQTEYLQALVGARTGEAALEAAFGATLPLSTGDLTNPTAPATPPGVAAPGTVPGDTIPNPDAPPLNPPLIELPPSGAANPGEEVR